MSKPKFYSVSSSMIRSVEYDDTNKELTVTFNNGSSYAYFDVPAKVVKQLVAADSVGRYFIANVKNTYNWGKK